MSSLRKPKAPWPFTDLPATSPNGLVDSTPVGLRAMSAIESAVSAAASARPACTAATRLAWSGRLTTWVEADAGVVGVAGLDGAGHHRELEVAVGGEARVVGDALGVAGGHQHRLADAVGRLGEGDLLAAGRVHEHAGGDDVEAAGLEAGDQRAELGQHAVDLGDAHLGEHGLGHLGRLAGQLALGRREAEGRLVGEADADVAVGLGLLERRLRQRPARWRGRRRGRRPRRSCRRVNWSMSMLFSLGVAVVAEFTGRSCAQHICLCWSRFATIYLIVGESVAIPARCGLVVHIREAEVDAKPVRGGGDRPAGSGGCGRSSARAGSMRRCSRRRRTFSA